jgi:hypothetical protein
VYLTVQGTSSESNFQYDSAEGDSQKCTSFKIQNMKKSSRAQIDIFGIAWAEDRERPELRHADALSCLSSRFLNRRTVVTSVEVSFVVLSPV